MQQSRPSAARSQGLAHCGPWQLCPVGGRRRGRSSSSPRERAGQVFWAPCCGLRGGCWWSRTGRLLGGRQDWEARKKLSGVRIRCSASWLAAGGRAWPEKRRLIPLPEVASLEGKKATVNRTWTHLVSDAPRTARREHGRASPELRSSGGTARVWAGKAEGPKSEEPSFGGVGRAEREVDTFMVPCARTGTEQGGEVDSRR